MIYNITIFRHLKHKQNIYKVTKNHLNIVGSRIGSKNQKDFILDPFLKILIVNYNEKYSTYKNIRI